MRYLARKTRPLEDPHDLCVEFARPRKRIRVLGGFVNRRLYSGQPEKIREQSTDWPTTDYYYLRHVPSRLGPGLRHASRLYPK